jgi:hypothetical protein
MVLAGNVLAEVSGGNLILRGDFDDNSLEIKPTGLAADQYEITGIGSTTINGGAGPLVLSGITKGLEAKLGDGDDSLKLLGGSFADKVKIEAGDGANFIELTSVTFGDDLEVLGKQGYDFVIVDDSTVSGNAKFKYDDGGDDGLGSFRSGRTIVLDSTFQGNLNIEGKDGTDSVFFDTVTIDGNAELKFGDGGLAFGANSGGTVRFDNSTFGGNLTIENEIGIDQFLLTASSIDGNVTIENGDGADDSAGDFVAAIPSSIVDSQIGGNLEYKSGDGEDKSFAIANSSIGGNVKLNFGEGGSSSEIALGTLIGGDLTIEAKRGSDTVAFDNAAVSGDTRVKTGDDDDSISVRDSVFAKFEADGGEGVDQFDDLGGNLFIAADSPKLKNIEIIN